MVSTRNQNALRVTPKKSITSMMLYLHVVKNRYKYLEITQKVTKVVIMNLFKEG